MRLFRPCFIAVLLYPRAVFRIRTTEKLLYLTFDDGPHPDSTPGLLQMLGKHSIKGMFFCNGKAAELYPQLVERIRSEGHMIGNHGFSHPDGWRTPARRYLEDVAKADSIVHSRFFRPPFGRMGIRQYRKLKDQYRIIMWDIMPYDFDKDFGRENSLKVLIKRVRPGSVIVLHDNPSSSANSFLEDFIAYAKEMGYRFGCIG